MTAPLDLDALLVQAEAAKAARGAERDWTVDGYWRPTPETLAYRNATADPAVVLALIERVRAAEGALAIAPEFLRLAELSDQVGAWKARAEDAEARLADVRALADEADASSRSINGYSYVLVRSLRAAMGRLAVNPKEDS